MRGTAHAKHTTVNNTVHLRTCTAHNYLTFANISAPFFANGKLRTFSPSLGEHGGVRPRSSRRSTAPRGSVSWKNCSVWKLISYVAKTLGCHLCNVAIRSRCALQINIEIDIFYVDLREHLRPKPLINALNRKIRR